jgi:hypothetical protein
MARGAQSSSSTLGAIPRDRQLAIDRARKDLYELVKKMSGVRKGSGALLARAVEVGPRGKGGAVLIPAADAEATMRRIEKLEDQIDTLESEIEDMNLAALIEERRETPVEKLLTVEELAGSIGRSHLLKEQ